MGLWLVLFALWPAAHFALVKASHVDPWRLGGWAMYCEPHLEVRTGLLGIRGGEQIPLPANQLPAGLQRDLAVFNMNRKALGDLRQPDALAHGFLAANPEYEGLTIVVQQDFFDTDTAIIRQREVRWSYP